MSELDRIVGELEARRTAQEAERRERLRLASGFLRDFFEQDIAPSETLRKRGIEARLVDNRLVLHRQAAAHLAEPLHIVVGEQGEIDVGGRSLGRYRPEENAAKKRELIGEIVAFFDL